MFILIPSVGDPSSSRLGNSLNNLSNSLNVTSDANEANDNEGRTKGALAAAQNLNHARTQEKIEAMKIASLSVGNSLLNANA